MGDGDRGSVWELGVGSWEFKVARGFESKMVEFQQEEAARGRSGAEAVSAEERARRERRRTAGARALARRGRSRPRDGPRAQAMLEQAIAALDAQLREVEPTRP